MSGVYSYPLNEVDNSSLVPTNLNLTQPNLLLPEFAYFNVNDLVFLVHPC